MFIPVFRNLFSNFKLDFISSTLVYSMDIKTLNSYHAVIFGGGDLINSYFIQVAHHVKKHFKGCIYAMSIGVPYVGMIKQRCFDPFDSIVVRFKSAIEEIEMAIGSGNVRYYPDFVMSITPYAETYNSASEKVGIFLADSFSEETLVNSTVSAIEQLLATTPYTYYLYPFDTKLMKSDIVYNTAIYEKLGKPTRLVNVTERLSPNDMIEAIRTCRFTICTRFHAHILSIITGVPFVSLHYANKVTELMQQNDYTYRCEVKTNEKVRPVTFSVEELLEKVHLVDEHRGEVHQHLAVWAKRDQMLLSTSAIQNLVAHGIKRQTQPHYLYEDRVDELTTKYTELIAPKPVPDFVVEDLIFDITRETTSIYKWGMIENVRTMPDKLRGMIDWVWKDKRKRVLSCPTINLDLVATTNFSNLHRAGWQFCIDALKAFSSPYGTVFDVYADATFGWAREISLHRGIIPYMFPWMGFFHHTPNPRYSDNSIENSTACIEFIQSLEMCRGLFVMSSWLADWLKERLASHGYPHIPIYVIKHPTLLHVPSFSPKYLDKEIRVVNVGAWLRNPFTIYAAKFGKGFKKYKLKGKEMDGHFPGQKFELSKRAIDAYDTAPKPSPFVYSMYEYIVKNGYLASEVGMEATDFVEGDVYSNALRTHIEKLITSVEQINFLENDEFDKLLTHNVMFLDLYEASAANTVIEAIARYNPIIINKIPPVVEYLGEEYPLYYTQLDQLQYITRERIVLTYEYLRKLRLRSELSIENFSEKFYKALQRSHVPVDFK